MHYKTHWLNGYFFPLDVQASNMCMQPYWLIFIVSVNGEGGKIYSSLQHLPTQQISQLRPWRIAAEAIWWCMCGVSRTMVSVTVNQISCFESNWPTYWSNQTYSYSQQKIKSCISQIQRWMVKLLPLSSSLYPWLSAI